MSATLLLQRRDNHLFGVSLFIGMANLLVSVSDASTSYDARWFSFGFRGDLG